MRITDVPTARNLLFDKKLRPCRDSVNNDLKGWRKKMEIIYIQDYDFDIQHISAKKNIIADAISRFVPRSIPPEVQDPVLALSEDDHIPGDKYIIISHYHNSKPGHGGFERTVSKLDADLYTFLAQSPRPHQTVHSWMPLLSKNVVYQSTNRDIKIYD